MNQASLTAMYQHIADADFPTHLVYPYVQLIWDEISHLEAIRQAGEEADRQLEQLRVVLDNLSAEDIGVLPFARVIVIEPVYVKAFGQVAVDVRVIRADKEEPCVRVAVRVGSTNRFQDYGIMPGETEIAEMYHWITRLVQEQAPSIWEWLLPIVYKMKESQEYVYP